MSPDLVTALLELDPEPLFVVDAAARIVYRNAAAAGLLAAGGTLTEDAGVLGARHHADQHAIASRASSLARLRHLAIADPSPLRLHGAPSVHVTFKPLDAPQRLVLVRVQDASALVVDRCRAFARSHGFSEAEAALLRAVVEGETV